MTESYEPRYCFMFESIMGLVIAFVALRMNVSLETEGMEEESNEGFWKDLKKNIGEIKEAFQIRAYYATILYLVIGGLLVPSFSSFDYFFMLDVVKVSNYTLSMLGLLGYACSIVGTQLFNSYFKKWEFHSMILINAAICIIMAPLSMLFVLRKNEEWGIPDMAIIIFTS